MKEVRGILEEDRGCGMTNYLSPERRGSAFDDRIVVSLSRHMVDVIIAEFEKLALNARDYLTQGMYRKVKDLFQDAKDEFEMSKDRRIYHKVTCPQCGKELESVVGVPDKFLAWCDCGCIFLGKGSTVEPLTTEPRP